MYCLDNPCEKCYFFTGSQTCGSSTLRCNCGISYFRYKCKKGILLKVRESRFSSCVTFTPDRSEGGKAHETRISFSNMYRTALYDTTCFKLFDRTVLEYIEKCNH